MQQIFRKYNDSIYVAQHLLVYFFKNAYTQTFLIFD